jgi:hypothetical protein
MPRPQQVTYASTGVEHLTRALTFRSSYAGNTYQEMLVALHRKATLLTLGAAVAVVMGTAVPVISSAMAEPNPCTGHSGDGGSGGWNPAGKTQDGYHLSHIYGTWYNCAGAGKSDHKRILVSSGKDGNCITVAYGSTGSSDFTSEGTTIFNDAKYGGWVNC